MIQTRILRALVMVLGLCSAARAQPSPAGPEAPAPATAPTSAPATAPTTAPATAPLSRDNISEAAIELTERERIALGAVRDRNTQLAETGFFMLLARAAKMGALSDQQLQDVESPSYSNLMAHPSRYRAQAIRMTISVFTSEKLEPTSGGAFPVTSHWPRERPVWYLTGLNASLKVDPQQPVMLYATLDPAAALGKPVEVRNQTQVYGVPGQRVDVVGLFYKLRRSASEENDERDYPVLLVWQLKAAGGGGVLGSSGGSIVGVLAVIMLVLALLLGFILLKRRVSRQKASRPGGPRYKPLRDVSLDDQGQPADQEDVGVDPLLKQAAEEYQKERQSDGKHGPS
ncbi:MAG TPA: hypothetical protein PLD58_22060 [Phycisphaerae bacterium]|nr:hypothetical protein [Phycisphaerae bacterium]